MNTFRQIRDRLGLTQAALAEKIGVSQGNVAHYERGQTVPPPVAQKLIDCAANLGHLITFDDVYAQASTQKINPANAAPEQLQETDHINPKKEPA